MRCKHNGEALAFIVWYSETVCEGESLKKIVTQYDEKMITFRPFKSIQTINFPLHILLPRQLFVI